MQESAPMDTSVLGVLPPRLGDTLGPLRADRDHTQVSGNDGYVCMDRLPGQVLMRAARYLAATAASSDGFFTHPLPENRQRSLSMEDCKSMLGQILHPSWYIS